MSVVLVPCNTRCLNMGDVAMLQVAVARLRVLWPWERICVFTSDASALLRYCPGVTAVLLPESPGWCTDRYLAGPLHALLRPCDSDRLLDLQRKVICRAPRIHVELLALRNLVNQNVHERDAFNIFVDAISTSNLVVTSGAGGVADHFRDYSNLVLLALRIAQLHGIPTAMLSHGFGPLTSPDLRDKAAAILPRVDLIAVREARASLPLLASMGVPADRVMTTGDDAIALAYSARPSVLGRGIGINLRLARSAATTEDDIPRVREALWRFAQRASTSSHDVLVASARKLASAMSSAARDVGTRRATARGVAKAVGASASASAAAASAAAAAAPAPEFFTFPQEAPVGGEGILANELIALPIARQRELDASVIRQLTGRDDPQGDGRHLDTPLKVIRDVGRCRIVVTGAYHAAVFALAQGIPAVCLARSPYFFDKFLGLAEQFGAGCHLVSLDDPELPERLSCVMRRAWDEAPALREELCEAAARQIAKAQAAYQHLHALVERHATAPPRAGPYG